MGRKTAEWLDRFLDLSGDDPCWDRPETRRLATMLVNLGSARAISERYDADTDAGHRKQLLELLMRKD